jgi:hypothetical protein
VRTAAYCYRLPLPIAYTGFGGERRGDFSGDLMPGVGEGFPGSGGSLMGPDHPMFGGPSGMGYPQVSSVHCNKYSLMLVISSVTVAACTSAHTSSVVLVAASILVYPGVWHCMRYIVSVCTSAAVANCINAKLVYISVQALTAPLHLLSSTKLKHISHLCHVK